MKYLRIFMIMSVLPLSFIMNAHAEIVTLKSPQSSYIVVIRGSMRDRELHFISPKNRSYSAYVYVGNRYKIDDFINKYHTAKTIRCDARLYGPGRDNVSGKRCVEFFYEYDNNTLPGQL